MYQRSRYPGALAGSAATMSSRRAIDSSSPVIVVSIIAGALMLLPMWVAWSSGHSGEALAWFVADVVLLCFFTSAFVAVTKERVERREELVGSSIVDSA